MHDAEAVEVLLKSGAGSEVVVGDLPPVEGCDIGPLDVAAALMEAGLLEIVAGP